MFYMSINVLNDIILIYKNIPSFLLIRMWYSTDVKFIHKVDLFRRYSPHIRQGIFLHLNNVLKFEQATV